MEYSTYCRPFCGRRSQQKKTKILKAKSRVMMTIAMLLMMSMHVYGQEIRKVSYINRYWDENAKELVSETGEVEAEVIDKVRYDVGQLGADKVDKWYIVDNKTTAQKKLSFEGLFLRGTVHIIVLDGCELKVRAGIYLAGDSELYIYSQSDGENQGKVIVTSRYGRPGIGNYYYGKTGNLYIHGCDIDVTGGPEGGAAIGTAQCGVNKPLFDPKDEYKLGSVYVYGGKVKAHGGKGGGAGIGSGSHRGGFSSGGHYYQYGGEVTAWGAEYAAGVGGGGCYTRLFFLPNTMGIGGDGIDVNVYGGKLTAYGGRRAAGIGSGSGPKGGGTGPGRLHMYGGTVYAKGGDYGAGVGGGCNGMGGRSYLYGGSLTAIGGMDAAGIGGGEDGIGCNCLVDGATVMAEGMGPAAGIGAGEGQCSFTFEYKSGTVVAIAGGDCKAREAKGGSAIGSGKKCKRKERFFTNNIIKLSGNCKVTAGDNVNNIERTFSKWERDPACRWRNYVKLEPCTHENAVFTYINEVRHFRECKNCEYAHEEKHSVEVGRDCPCGKKYNADTDTWLVTVVESADGKTYAAGKEQRIVRGRDFALSQAASIEGLVFMGYIEATTAPASLEMQDSEYTSLLMEGTTVTPKGDCTYYARYRYDYNEEWVWSDDLSAATVKINNNLLGEARVLTATVTEITEERVEPVGTELGRMSLQASASYESGSGVVYEFNDYCKTEYFNIASVELDAAATNNEEILEPYEDHVGSVSIDNLTFKKDGKLHPLCLPVSLTQKEIDAGPLAGATFYLPEESKLVGSQLQINFKKVTEDYFLAGVPYFVKWTSGTNVVDPVFTYAHIHSTTPESIADFNYSLAGTFDMTFFDVEELNSGAFLTLNDEGQLVDVPDGMVDAFSNYLYIPRTLAEDGTTAICSVRLSFEDDITVEKLITYGFEGEGTKESPYLIQSARQLNDMATYFNNSEEGIKGKYFKQAANIIFDKTVENNFTPVNMFNGHYDGGGYIISGVNINKSGTEATDDVAMFVRTAEGSTLKNIIVANSTFTGRSAAALVYSLTASIDNCHLLKDVSVRSNYHAAGGIVAYMNDGTPLVTNCSSQASVTANQSYAGGVVGMLLKGSVTNCMYLGNSIEAKPGSVKSCVVSVNNGLAVEDCYFTAPTLSDRRAKLMPNITEDNTNFLTQLHARDQFLLEGNSGLKEEDICYDLTINGREFKAVKKDDDTWTSRTYAISLPFDMEIPYEQQEEILVYKLHEIDTEKKEFIFTNEFPILKAGVPYLLVLNKGSLIFNGKNVLVKAAPNEPETIINADGSKKLGHWCSNFRRHENEELVEEKAYIMQSNGTYRHIAKVYASRPYVARYQAYFSAAEPIGTSFKMKFVRTENGEETDEVTDFPADLFYTDCDVDDPTGIQTIVNGQCSMFNVQCYDLQGRKLSGKPNKGIYIQNGKIIIIK